MEFYLSLLLFALSSAVVGAQVAVRLLYLPERKRFLKLLSDMQQIAAEQFLKIETLQRQSLRNQPTSEQLSIQTRAEYEAYQNGGGKLDLLSWLLAQDDHLRFP
ncbi:MAG: hypothetical protein BGN96_12200 [Bacteroidales bacterium 45-6]|nr:MAG: hypothetical protein BGN96_12200 [Bacteroidales bacterium 45-6]